MCLNHSAWYLKAFIISTSVSRNTTAYENAYHVEIKSNIISQICKAYCDCWAKKFNAFAFGLGNNRIMKTIT